MATPTNPYLELTREFNRDRVRAIISSGQAVVLHRLAITSKDGDWILREDAASTDHVLGVLEARGARYRFGAPLDIRWMRGGYSAHFEHLRDGLRIRTDFVTRPARVSAAALGLLWTKAEAQHPPVVDVETLALIKMTDREKDWPVIGELARLLQGPREQLRFSRSPRDILLLLRQQPGLRDEMVATRPALAAAALGEEALGAALDAERRQLMRANEARLERYEVASKAWRRMWPQLERDTRGLSLRRAHDVIVAKAQATLPFEVTPHV